MIILTARSKSQVVDHFMYIPADEKISGRLHYHSESCLVLLLTGSRGH
jgi:hypothetical protein